MFQSFLDYSVFNIVYPILLFVAVFLGILLGVKYTKRRRWESSGIENSIIGIFGLIISFTFLTAGNAHRERYTFIHQEANAAELLFRYSRDMPDSFAEQTRTYLINFLDNQTGFTKKEDNAARPVISNAVTLFENYWVYKTSFEHKNNDPAVARKLDNISRYFDDMKSSFLRISYSYNERTPSTVLFLLIISSLLIGFLIGFMNGVNTGVHYLVPLIYVVFVSMIMLVIRDLNNPIGGIVRPNFQDLITVNDYIKSH